MKPAPGVKVIIAPEPDGSHSARFAGARSQRVGRGPTEWEAVRDLYGGGRPGKGQCPPYLKAAVDLEDGD